ncbi:ATP-binding protein [Pelagicoccus mobilis]|uniref:histidine kinase n=1 Tax=Pelagicoccus mobilis TaxID=415221 RepID=A0A934RVZ5_9BACT|nr:ATP-binding protein [Pelagicoccus mobilis]MBK1875806.1 response regulator [Pelagicoccus mobilis]
MLPRIHKLSRCGLFAGLPRALVLALLLVGATQLAWALEPYVPQVEVSLEEEWRWTKLEAASGLNIRDAALGHNGEVWFYQGATVYRYDGNRLDPFPITAEGSGASHILAASDGHVYALSGKNFVRFDGDGWRVISQLDERNNRIHHIRENGKRELWFANADRLVRYDLETSRRDEFPWDFRDPLSFVIDHNGKLWLSDRESLDVVVLDLERATEAGIPELHRFSSLSPANTPRLELDSQGRVWALDFHGFGHSLFENYTRKEVSVEDSTVLTRPRCMAEVPQGRYWFGSNRSLIELNEGKWKVHNARDTKLPLPVNFVVTLPGDRLLAGGINADVYLIDLSNDRWAAYDDLNFQCEDHQGNEWFIHHDGRIIKHDTSVGQWTAFDTSDGTIDHPNSIICSSDGTLWASGSHQDFTALSRNDSGQWERFEFPRLGRIFSHLAAKELNDGSLVFGNGASPLYLGDLPGGAVFYKNGVFTQRKGGLDRHVLFPERIACIDDTSEGDLWIGVGSLMQIRADGSIQSYNSPNPNRRWIDQVLIDKEDTVWVAIGGLGLFEFDGKNWTPHTAMDAVASKEVAHMLESKDGQLKVLSEEGVSQFDGTSWISWKLPHDVRFLREEHILREDNDGALWVNFSYRPWLLQGKRQESRANWYRTIRYKGNTMSPETSLIDRDQELPEGSRLTFRWEGHDAWNETPSDELYYSWHFGDGNWSPYSRQTSVVVDKVKAGEYRFEVRAIDQDMNVDPTPAILTVQVVPPLWKRPWFIFVVAATVVTILVLVWALLKARVQSAIKVESFKLEFFTNLSHELTNPLAAIVAPLENALRQELPGNLRRNLKIALRNSWKMKTLVSQLLQFRKVELGMARYTPALGEIMGFVKDAVECQDPLLSEKNLSVVIKTSQPHFKCGYDADKLQKIVDNLVSNAIKYSTENGQIRVKVDVSSNEGHDEIVLTVEDEGVGIPKDKIESVLKPFYRVGDHPEKQEGFGIGLALVEQLVSLCGGRFDLESPIKDGHGTRAVVHFPVVNDKELHHEIELHDEEEQIASDSKEDSNANRAKILLVEDNSDLRLFMREALCERYDTFEAENGEEGLKLAHKTDLDLIITDIMMPVMDGFELCRQLRSDSQTSHIPIIVLTAKGANRHRITAAELGADAYFSKPLNMLSLIAQIENVLKIRRELKQRFSEQLVIEPTEVTVTPSDEALLRKAIELVEDNIEDEKYTVIQFSKDMGMSQPSLCRTLKGLTGQTPNPFIRSLRLKRSAQLLKSGNFTVSEVLTQVGIPDQSYFSRIFKKEFGVSPSQYAHQEQDKTSQL